MRKFRKTDLLKEGVKGLTSLVPIALWSEFKSWKRTSKRGKLKWDGEREIKEEVGQEKGETVKKSDEGHKRWWEKLSEWGRKELKL